MSPRERRIAELRAARDRLDQQLAAMHAPAPAPTPEPAPAPESKPKRPRKPKTLPTLADLRDAASTREEAEVHRFRALARWGYTPAEQAKNLRTINRDAAALSAERIGAA